MKRKIKFFRIPFDRAKKFFHNRFVNMKTTHITILANFNPFPMLKNINRVKLTVESKERLVRSGDYSFATFKMSSHRRLFQSVYIHLRRVIKMFSQACLYRFSHAFSMRRIIKTLRILRQTIAPIYKGSDSVDKLPLIKECWKL